MTSAYTPPSRPPISDALVSVVLPVCNESAVLVELFQRLRTALIACRTTFEILFVNDGSSDGSAALLDRLARQFAEVRVVHFSRNFGHQAAIQAGLAHAHGDAVVLMDADLQDPPEAIAEMLEAWQAGYDVVYAIRTDRKEALWKRTLFAGFHRLMSAISRPSIPVDAGNFGLIDARVVKVMMALGERDRYLPGLRSWVGFKQIGIPVERRPRYDAHPRVSLPGLARLAKTAIFSFSTVPLAMFAWLGVVSLMMFTGLGGYAVCCRLFTDALLPVWISQLTIVSFFTALNALGISILGEYMLRIYDQVRARPLYLIDRTVNFAAAESQPAESSGNQQPEGASAPQADALELDRLDPLQLTDGWDNAYQHLLTQAQDLIELGALARSEADDLADQQTHATATRDELAQFATDASALAPDATDEPRLLKLSDAAPRR